MTTPRQSALSGHWRRLCPPPSLATLASRVVLARADLKIERGATLGRTGIVGIAPRELLTCLEAYAAALLSRGLPIPPALRDELRLRRGL
jgi:hypothetical protein